MEDGFKLVKEANIIHTSSDHHMPGYVFIDSQDYLAEPSSFFY